MRVYLFILLAFVACKNEPKEAPVKKSNSAVSKKGTIQVDEFNGLELAIDATLIVLKGETQKVDIKGPLFQIEALKKEVKDGVWKIEYNQQIDDAEQMSITVHTPLIKILSIAGNGRGMISRNIVDTVDASLSVAGNGNLRAMLESNANVRVSLAGNGTVDLIGSAENVDYSLNGTGTINAEGLVIEAGKVSLAGSGTCQVNVKSALDVTLTGSGNVLYVGNPEITESITGSGALKRKE